MDKVLSIIKRKGLGDIFMAAALLLAIVGLILYCLTGATIFNPNLNSKVIASLGVAVGLSILFLVFSTKMGRYLVYLLLLFAFIEFINSQVTYIANVFVAIDGSTFSASFVGTFLSILLAAILAFVSGILTKDEAEIFRLEVQQ